MFTLEEAATKLGLSQDQLRRRLRAVLRHLDGQVSARVARGPHGQLLLPPDLVAFISEIEAEARQAGLSFAAALARRLAPEWAQPEQVGGDAGPDARLASPLRQAGGDNGKIIANAIITAGALAGGIVGASILIAAALMGLLLRG